MSAASSDSAGSGGAEEPPNEEALVEVISAWAEGVKAVCNDIMIEDNLMVVIKYVGPNISIHYTFQ